jgi:hypothetical protein
LTKERRSSEEEGECVSGGGKVTSSAERYEESMRKDPRSSEKGAKNE